MPLKQLQFRHEKPVIYADSNVYRYVKHGEVEIVDPDRFVWAYSHVHLSEIANSSTLDALDGMQILKAVEVSDNLNEEFKSTGNVTLNPFIDLHQRYQNHLDTTSGYEDIHTLFSPLMTRLHGANNLDELSALPKRLLDEIKNMTESLDYFSRNSIISKAEEVAQDLKETINIQLKELRSIDKTRAEFGLNSEKRKELESSDSPIDDVWKILEPHAGGISKFQFFGLEPTPYMHNLQHTQDSVKAGAHAILNMIGFSPDKGLSKGEKFKNISSDGAHIGMASYCNAILSADTRLCNKAKAIYRFINYSTAVLYFPYNSDGNKLYINTKS